MATLYTNRLALKALNEENLKLAIADFNMLEKKLALKITRKNIGIREKEVYKIRLKGLIENPERFQWSTPWIIIEKKENRIIGAIMIKNYPDENGEVVIGYAMQEDYRRKGYMYEALNQLNLWIFENPDVKAIVADTLKENEKSHGLLKKLSMIMYKEDDECFFWRMIRPEEHELIYKKLKTLGYNGWGGHKYDYRMQGWDDNISKIFSIVDNNISKILELGCGAGDVSLKLAELGYDVMGIDISPTAIEWASEKAENRDLKARFLSENVSNTNLFEDEKFELIIDGNCLHCLFDEDRKNFYQNVKNSLRENGKFFISSAILTNHDDPIPKLSSIDRCVMTRENLESELASFGFIKEKSWISKHSNHSHYRAIYNVSN